MSYFTTVLAREGRTWSVHDLDVDALDTLRELAAELRVVVAGDDAPVLLLVEREDAWWGVVRVDGEEDPRVFVSDAAGAAASPYAGILEVVVVPDSDDDEGDEDDEAQVRPVRLSLMRTNLPAVRKLHSLIASAGRKTNFWDFVFDLSTFRKDFARGSSHLLQVRRGRKTSDEEKQNAVALAQEVIGGRTQDNAENAADSEKPVEPTREGGVDL